LNYDFEGHIIIIFSHTLNVYIGGRSPRPYVEGKVGIAMVQEWAVIFAGGHVKNLGKIEFCRIEQTAIISQSSIIR
jgi:hypothetical protein